MNPAIVAAYALETTPPFVYQDAAGTWRDFVVDMSEQSELIHPLRFYAQVNATARTPLQLTPEEVCAVYVVGNTAFQEFVRQFDRATDATFAFQSEVALDETSRQIIDNLMIPEVFNEYREKFEADEDAFRTYYETHREEFERAESEMDALRDLESLAATTVEVKSLVKVYKIGDGLIAPHVDAVFNRLSLSETFPLLVGFRFYKVRHGYEFDLERENNLPTDEYTLYAFTRLDPTRVEIRVHPQQGIYVSYQFRVDETDTTFRDQVCAFLGLSPADLTLSQERFNIVARFEDRNLAIPVWKDLVTNHPALSREVYIDDQTLLGSRRSAGLYTYYLPDGRVDQKIPFHLMNDDFGLRVRLVNTPSRQTADALLERIGKYLTLYAQEHETIVQTYNTLARTSILTVQPFVVIESLQEHEKVLKDLKRRAPDLFVPQYSRPCAKVPMLLTEEQGAQYEEQLRASQEPDSNVRPPPPFMRFPKPEDAQRLGRPPLYLSCLNNIDSEYIYPGLRRNTQLSNRDRYTLIPCCYPENQTQKKGSFYYKYFNSTQLLADFAPDVETLRLQFLTSEAFVAPGQAGACPALVTDWCSLYTPTPPVRNGVERSPYSVVACILRALGRPESAEEAFARLREAPVDVCAQELWDTPDARLQIDTYVDPRRWFRLLETEYGCRLLMVTRTRNSQVDVIHPHHTHGYLRWKASSQLPIVWIYEHFGTEPGQLYPQCEWIQVATAEAKEAIYRDYWKACETIALRVHRQEPLPHFVALDAIEAGRGDIQEQLVDAYGKVFGLVTNDRHVLLLEQSRLPPLPNVPISRATRQVPLQRSLADVLVYWGPYRCIRRALTPADDKSLLEQFNSTRIQVQLLYENAKRVMMQRTTPSDRLRNWDFIQVNSNRVVLFDKYAFTDSSTLYVPNSVTKERLERMLRLYYTRFPNKAEEYLQLPKNPMLPFRYQSIMDFEASPGVSIADTDTVIAWSSPLHFLQPVDGTLYLRSFLTVVQNVIYKCDPVGDRVPMRPCRVLVPQLKHTFMVTGTAGSTDPAPPLYLAIVQRTAPTGKRKSKNTAVDGHARQFYVCTPVGNYSP